MNKCNCECKCSTEKDLNIQFEKEWESEYKEPIQGLIYNSHLGLYFRDDAKEWVPSNYLYKVNDRFLWFKKRVEL